MEYKAIFYAFEGADMSVLAREKVCARDIVALKKAAPDRIRFMTGAMGVLVQDALGQEVWRSQLEPMKS